MTIKDDGALRPFICLTVTTPPVNVAEYYEGAVVEQEQSHA